VNSPVKFVPAQPAVTETTVKVITPAQPEKFVVTLTRTQAMFLRACVGLTNDTDLPEGWELFQALPAGPRGSEFLDPADAARLAQACTKAASSADKGI
jgi:hypothetical protein